jgi:transcriptional regulator with XRE-family HTH domain
MITFGKKIAILRKELGWSQSDIATKLNTSVSVISRYERDEMTPSIDAAKKLADLLGSTVGYLLGENEESNLFKDPEMLDRFKAIKGFKDADKEKIYFTIDAMIHEVSNRKQYANK